jgi:hypothetical protein
MNDNIPDVELPEFATLKERLMHNIALAREAVSIRVGYEVEMAGLEPIERDGHAHMRIYWRRKPVQNAARRLMTDAGRGWARDD